MNNVFGRAFYTKLPSEVRAIKTYEQDGKNGPETVNFTAAKHDAAIYFYMNSYSADDKTAIIGRLDDTKQVKSEGHVQMVDTMNAWSILANDCWMLGCFHSAKDFRLRTMDYTAVWDGRLPGTAAAYRSFPVTRREICSLLEFGFKPVQKTGDYVIFENTRPSEPLNATLPDYHAAVTLEKRNSKLVSDFIAEYLQERK